MVSYARVYQTYKEVFLKAGGLWAPPSFQSSDQTTVSRRERTARVQHSQLRCENPAKQEHVKSSHL